MSWIEREERRLEEDFEKGLISQEDFNTEMRELQRDYREAARESAWGAYEEELRNW